MTAGHAGSRASAASGTGRKGEPCDHGEFIEQIYRHGKRYFSAQRWQRLPNLAKYLLAAETRQIQEEPLSCCYLVARARLLSGKQAIDHGLYGLLMLIRQFVKTINNPLLLQRSGQGKARKS